MSNEVGAVHTARSVCARVSGTRPEAIAPITVPMKNGTMSEEKAKAAPNRRCQRSVSTSLRKAKPAPRSTIPKAASHSGRGGAGVTGAEAGGGGGAEKDTGERGG